MKVGTDFSGIGAPEMALKYLGIDFESVFACDIDKYARQSFEQLHKPKKFYNDITTRNHKEVEQLDLYVAGFPCQAFSIAGQRKGFDEARGTLFFNVAEFIKINQPKVFILENVKGLLSHDKGRTFQTIIDILSNGGGTQNGQIGLDVFEDGLGYNIYWQVLNTKNYGIPQNRERVFIIGFKEFREFTFPKPIQLELNLGDILQDNPKSKYFLSDKTIKSFTKHKKRHTEKGTGFKWEVKKKDDIANCLRANASLCPTDNTIEVEHKYYLSDKAIENLQKRQNFNKFDPLNEKSESASCITARANKVSNDNNFILTHYLGGRKGNPKKGGTGHLSKSDGTSYCLDTSNTQAIQIIGYSRDKNGKVTSRNLKDCANTIHSSTGSDGNTDQFVNDTKIRRLTPLECWRLQGFRDEDFFSVKDVSDTQLYKQAGNSITVDVLIYIFKKIYGN